MTSSLIEKIAIAFPIALGCLPLARVLRKRAFGERARHARGAHAKPSGSSGSTAGVNPGHAIRLASISVFATIVALANPHGLVFWTIIGVSVAILLWEPATWFTAYLVRKINEQGT